MEFLLDLSVFVYGPMGKESSCVSCSRWGKFELVAAVDGHSLDTTGVQRSLVHGRSGGRHGGSWVCRCGGGAFLFSVFCDGSTSEDRSSVVSDELRRGDDVLEQLRHFEGRGGGG